MEEDQEFNPPWTGRKLQRSLSTSSVESLLPPPTPYKKFMVCMLALLSVTTLAQIVICCVYSDISGHAEYWYEHSRGWQFCTLYAGYTIQTWDKKLLDSLPASLSYMGLVNGMFTWVALAVTFRALYHYEWIPSSLAFIAFNVFGQLCYYQSSNLVIVPSKLVASLASFTAYVKTDMYDNLGYLCFSAVYDFGLATRRTTELFSNAIPNCTESVILVETEALDQDDFVGQLEAVVDTAIPNDKLQCGGAVALHIIFLALSYFFVVITLLLGAILVIADRKIRQRYPARHFFKETAEDLVGARYPQVLVSVATLGYVMTSIANCDASLLALQCVKTWRLIDYDTDASLTTSVHIDLLDQDIPVNVDVDVDFTFDVETWYPFKTNQLDIQTVLLIITVMAVIRGSFKQSIAGFRLAAVTSLLAAIVQWPVIVGSMETFNLNHLWWWDSMEKCKAYHSGIVYMYPDSQQSERYCWDTRFSILGALLTFVAIHINIIACSRVFTVNLHRKSLVIDALDFYEPVLDAGFGEEKYGGLDTALLGHSAPENGAHNAVHRESGDSESAHLPDAHTTV